METLLCNTRGANVVIWGRHIKIQTSPIKFSVNNNTPASFHQNNNLFKRQPVYADLLSQMVY